MSAPAQPLDFAFSAFYTFSSNVAEPPTGTQLRINAGPPYDTATKLWVRYLTTDDIDGYFALMDVPPASEIFIQDKNDHTRYASFHTIAAAIDKGGYVEYAVTPIANSGSTFANNATVMMAPFEPVTSTTPDIVPGPSTPLDFSHITLPAVLVPLAEAKAHLRITDTVHDADITVMLEAAQDQVLAKLGPSADPTWTDTTAPRPVRHAIKILLDAFYERRGGDESSESLRKALDVIDLLLALYHDPTLA